MYGSTTFHLFIYFIHFFSKTAKDSGLWVKRCDRFLAPWLSSYQSEEQKHKRLNRTLFNQSIQDSMQVFKVVLFFKLRTGQKQTIKGITNLLPVGFFQLPRMSARDSSRIVSFDFSCAFDFFPQNAGSQLCFRFFLKWRAPWPWLWQRQCTTSWYEGKQLRRQINGRHSSQGHLVGTRRMECTINQTLVSLGRTCR